MTRRPTEQPNIDLFSKLQRHRRSGSDEPGSGSGASLAAGGIAHVEGGTDPSGSKHVRTTGIAALVASAVLLLAGCPLNTSVDFDDYESVNLIGSRGFDSGLWYFQDGVTAGTTDPVTGETASVDYVQWESTSENAPAGVAGPVYRLRIPNLLPNGDFENGDLSHDGVAGDDWVSSETSTTGTGISNGVLESGTPIQGNHSLRLNFTSTTVYYAIDLSSTLSDGFPSTARYSFRMLLNSSVPNFGMEMHNHSGATDDPADADTNNRFSVSLTGIGTVLQVPTSGDTSETAPVIGPRNMIVANTSFPYLSFGGYLEATQDAAVVSRFDDLRIVRSDRSYYVRLPVPFRESGRPDLNQNGSYTISVWVKEDPLAGSNNRFTPSHLSLGMDSTPGTPGGEISTPVELTGIGSWKQVSVTFNGFPFPAVDTSGSTPILEVLIEIGYSQGGPEYIQPGSVLLAGPTLNWNPEQ